MPRKFVFRLESMLGLRRAFEEKKRNELALAQREVHETMNALLEMFQLEAREKDEARHHKQGAINIVTLRLQEAFLNHLTRRMSAQQEKINQARAKELKARAEYIEARKNVRLLERLKERKLRNWQYETSREETRNLDEVASYRHQSREEQP